MKRYEAGCGAKTKLMASCVLGVALMASLPACAETIFLKCDKGADWGSNRYENLTVDLANSTVDNHPAKINATEIDWETATPPGSIPEKSGGGTVVITGHHHIDRAAGTITETYHWEFSAEVTHGADPAAQTYPCAVGSAPATKF